MTPMITITDNAATHFRAMLDKQAKPGTHLRIYVLQPGTSLAHCGIAYWHADHNSSEDAYLDFPGFRLYYASEQAPYLEAASVDYRKVFSGNKLFLEAPNAKAVPPVDENSPLAQRITYVLETEVNPHLSEHSGTVMLGQIKEGGVVTLKFGGSCHGCGHAELTMRDTVEKTLLERFPNEITAVVDETSHEEGTTPYFPRKTAVAA